MAALPDGFINLRTAKAQPVNTLVNIIGVVVDKLDPVPARGGSDLVFTFDLQDQKVDTRDQSFSHEDRLPVRFFRPTIAELPTIKSLGDVVLLWKVKLITYAGRVLACSNWFTTFLVFPAAAIPRPEWSISFMGQKQKLQSLGTEQEQHRLSLEQQTYIIALHQLVDFKSERRGDSGHSEASPRRALDDDSRSHRAAAHSVDAVKPLPSHHRDPLRHPDTFEGSRRSGYPIPPGQQPNNLGDSYRPKYPSGTRQPDRYTNVSSPGLKRLAPTHDTDAVVKEPRLSISKKFQTVAELQDYKFADLCVQVVKKYLRSDWECELYVTDYSENKLLFYYAPPEDGTADGTDGDRFGYTQPSRSQWPGPYGHLVLKVVTSPPHSTFAKASVEVGDLILMSNVKIKMDGYGKLQGDLWLDGKYPDKIDIRKLRPDGPHEVQALLARKEQYWSTRTAQTVPPGAEQKTLSRKESRKNKKKRIKEAQVVTYLAKQEIQRANQHVRCSDIEIPLSKLRLIVDKDHARHINNLPDGVSYILPFVNAKFRVKVKVIDFFPPAIEDFATPDDEPSADSSADFTSWESSPKWGWSFSILVQDATVSGTPTDHDKLWLTVGVRESEYLFGNGMGDPADLRRDPILLAKLKEKLCILWGDLAEQKASSVELAPSNRPFECCIAEYGTLKDGGEEKNIEDWERSYMLFGATIP